MMRSGLPWLSCFLGAVLLLAGCAVEPPYVLTCDITEVECQTAVYESIADLLNADSTAHPSVRVISVDHYEQELRERYATSDNAGRELWVRGLKLMGLFPESFEVSAEEQIQNQVADAWGYYDHEATSVTVIDREYDEIDSKWFLTSLYARAIQDRRFGFDVTEASSTDEWIARRSLAEGDAARTSTLWLDRLFGYERDSREWNYDFEIRQDEAVAAAADLRLPVSSSAEAFPAAYGRQFIYQGLFSNALQKRTCLFESPPETTRAIMRRTHSCFRASSIERFRNPAVTLPSLAAGFEEVTYDSLGAWYVFSFLLRLGLPEEEAWDNALGWAGDRFSVYGDGTNLAVAWRIHYEFDADELAGETSIAVARSERGARWEAIQDGRDVIIIAVDDGLSLEDWTAF